MATVPKLRELYDEMRVAEGAGRARAAAAGAGHEDPFILKLSQLVLSYGAQIKASDIHIEPTAGGARIRYRIDGILHELLQLPQETRDPLIRAIKTRANMATDVVGRSKPQDSRIDLEWNSRKIDLRISSFPTLFGDVLAIRILDRSAPLLELEQVGFPPDVLKDFERLIKRPNGLLLVTGPTGSGKTTTLYAALNKLRSPYIKIVTLEDPVEYQLEGIDQAQINPTAGVTFASGLRAILRQDTNVIFIGEIRDKETAEIVIRAALTGHLVFSTLHTRNSIGAVTRLMDMGVEPHLIIASVNGIVAQRLVRLVCSQCRAPDPIAGRTFAQVWEQELGAPPPVDAAARLVKGAGCPACNLTGYRGRVGLFELLVIDDALRQIIFESAGPQLEKRAVAAGKLRTLRRNGLEKAAQGLTSIEEVLRVTGADEL